MVPARRVFRRGNGPLSDPRGYRPLFRRRLSARVEFPDRLIRNPQDVEIVVAQYDNIAELAYFDGT